MFNVGITLIAMGSIRLRVKTVLSRELLQDPFSAAEWILLQSKTTTTSSTRSVHG
jgi:hypothetical protein